MAKKPKARGTKGKAKTPKKEKPQRARFIEAARRVGVDETGAEFEQAIKKIALARPKH
jgi:hypothetical protein